MAEFYPAVTTDLGITLAADLLVGEQMVFTKLVAGSGIYTEDETVRTNLQKAEALREPRQEFAFSSIKKETDACVLLKTLLSNISLTEGYRMTEIGVYAKRIGEEGDGILYSLSVAKEADYFPRYNGMAAVEIIEEYYITVSDAAEVTIETGRSAAVLIEDLEKMQAEINKRLDDLMSNLKTNCFKSADDPFVLMTEATYKPPSLRTKGSLYAMVTKKQGVVINTFDRYVAGMESPTVKNTLYGVERRERTEGEREQTSYRGILKMLVPINDGQDVERQANMLYAVTKKSGEEDDI